MKPEYYNSPRWSGEILDCSMPLTMDTYSHCSYNCLYCFSFFQKSHTMGKGGAFTGKHAYQATHARPVNVQHVKDIFNGTKPSQFTDYIKERRVMQWGGLSDPFDENERRQGVTLELLKFFKEINYPICFSTKATWWVYDDRYRDLFRGQENWNVKFSIINLCIEMAKWMEKGVPGPWARLQAMYDLAKLKAGGVTLRLRPFIIGMTNLRGNHMDLIKQAARHGATAVSTEFFCLEARADARLRARYHEMSAILEYDIYEFYKKYSKGAGYRRLNRKLKEPYINEMEQACQEVGLRFYVSDAHFKERCANGSCCGLPPGWNYSRGQFTEALLIAKRKKVVYFSDIEKHIKIYKKFLWRQAAGFNTTGPVRRAAAHGATMFDFIRNAWNTPNGNNSPYKYFGGVLVPIGVDRRGDVVYEYKEGP